MSHFTNPLHLKPRFSKRFAVILMGIHGGALLLLLPLMLPLTVKVLIGILILASARYTSRKHLQYIHHPLYGCMMHYETGIQLITGKMAEISDSYSHPQLVILSVQGHALIIWKDALDVQTFRQLRVHLRHA
ncbi:MAG: hypothetical protein KAH77_06460 [Thiomargarita sp.]|nr:hypothetical protein [Thiomargarita sp.]